MPNIALSYAAVILADAEVEVTADKILALTKSANIEDIEPIVAQLYAAAVSKSDVKKLLVAFGSTAGAGASAAAGGAAAAGADDTEAAAEEQKKAEEEEESDDMDMGMLF